jgi:hypothetical protein
MTNVLSILACLVAIGAAAVAYIAFNLITGLL